MLQVRTILLLVVLLLIGFSTAIAQPTVQFTTTQYSFAEHFYYVEIPLVFTELPTESVMVVIWVTPGTATPDYDYADAVAYAYFNPGDSDTVYTYVHLIEDVEIEDDETIILTISELEPGYQVGTPSSATLIIEDDDSPTPTVRFTSTQFSFVEELAEVSIGMVMTGDLVQDPTRVGIGISEGTAVAGTDYEMVETAFVEFELFESDTSYAHFIIYEDEDQESPETIILSILDGGGNYTVGQPDEAVLTIIDDDSDTPLAHFEIDEDIPLAPDGSISVLTEPGVEIRVDVVVEDLPPEGAIIYYTSTGDGLTHSLEFDTNPRQTIVVPAVDTPPEEVYSFNTLHILNPVGRKSTESESATASWVYLNRLGFEPQQCAECLIWYFTIIARDIECDDDIRQDCGAPCVPAANSRGGLPGPRPAFKDWPSSFATLKRYRDEILTGSPGGDYYIQLYQDHSLAVGTAILQRPTLIHRVLETQDLWLPAVAAQVDGQGASFTITGEMQAALLGIMSAFEEVGSTELAQLMTELRTELDLENVAGTTASDLQEAIEANPMDTQSTTWGGLKAMFRDRE